MKFNGIKITSVTNSNQTVIDWILGNYCNFKCTYCFGDLNTGTFRVPEVDNIIKNNIRHLVEQLSQIGKNNLTFQLSGGEPTVYHDLDNLIIFLSNFGKITIISNGSRTKNWWKNNYQNFNKVILSYHSEYSNLDHMIEISKILLDKVSLSVHIMMNNNLFDESKNAAIKFNEIFNRSSLSLQLKLLRSSDGKSINYTEEQKKFVNEFNHVTIKNEKIDTTSRPIINLDDSRTIIFHNKHLINLTGNFNGYECYAHHEFLQIDQYGNIGKMSCGKEFNKISNIYSSNFINDFKILDQKIICDRSNSICGCLGLLYATKKLPKS